MAFPSPPRSKALPSGQVAAALPAVPRGVCWVLTLVLGGCSGTPFGEALSRSFPDPAASRDPATTAVPLPATPSSAATSGSPAGASKPVTPTAPGTPKAPGTPTATAPAATTPPAAGTPQAGTPSAAASPGRSGIGRSPVSTARRPPAAPVPYRVTLRLPQADPAAPAEVVTEALRGAGVPFEVETIERLGVPSAAPAAPSVRPAPAPVPVSPR